MKDEIVFKNLKTLISHNIPKSEFFKKKNKVEPDQMIFFGHHNWTMVFFLNFSFLFFYEVLNMIIGIQKTVKSIVSNPILSEEDYKLSYFFEIIPKFAFFIF